MSGYSLQPDVILKRMLSQKMAERLDKEMSEDVRSLLEKTKEKVKNLAKMKFDVSYESNPWLSIFIALNQIDHDVGRILAMGEHEDEIFDVEGFLKEVLRVAIGQIPRAGTLVMESKEHRPE